ncbi:unnamed protein product, partial [Closterium sp. NIES-54]
FPDAVELPRWHDLLLQNVPIFDLDFDAILAAMYALSDSAEGDCYLSVPPDPGIAAAALGASASAAPGTGETAAPGTGESALSGTAPTESLRTLPRFYRFAPGGQRVTHCTCSRKGRHLATFIRRPGSSLYTLTTALPPVSASSQVFVAASRPSPAYAPCSCRPLSNETLLWHHRLGHPSLPRLRGMASRNLVSGLPRFLPPLPPGPAPTCVPCVEGRQHAAPHSSTFPHFSLEGSDCCLLQYPAEIFSSRRWPLLLYHAKIFIFDTEDERSGNNQLHFCHPFWFCFVAFCFLNRRKVSLNFFFATRHG